VDECAEASPINDIKSLREWTAISIPNNEIAIKARNYRKPLSI
jgi:hypothetical protein